MRRSSRLKGQNPAIRRDSSQRATVALHQGNPRSGRSSGVQFPRLVEHPGRQVGRDRTPALRLDPSAALGSTGPDLEDVSAAHGPQQTGRRFAQALGTPTEVGIPEKGTVLGVVVLGLGVPPRSVGRDRLCAIGAATESKGFHVDIVPERQSVATLLIPLGNFSGSRSGRRGRSGLQSSLVVRYHN